MLTRRLIRNDDGIAMLTVIGTMLTLMVILTAALGYAVNLQPQVRHSEDWNAALAAAQAGVDDFLGYLNKDDSYLRTVDCTNQALVGPKPDPAADTNTCGWTSTTAPGWVAVEPGNPAAGQFHYDVNSKDFLRNGSVWLESTGKVDNVSRTIQVRVGRGGSTEFLYYTDFEDADPANLVSYPPGSWRSLPTGGARYRECGANGASQADYWWEGGNRRNSNICSEIGFATQDVLDGAVHFNDSPLMYGSGGARPRFLQGYQTADPNCTTARGKADSNGVGTNAGDGYCWRNTSGTNPYVGPNGARPTSPLYLPDNSDAFRNYPGCHYTGDTRIRFNGNGTMDVWNTGSAGTSVTGPGTEAGVNCGNAAQFVPASGKKYPASKQTVPIPNDLVIYVKNSSSGTERCVPGQIVNATTSGSIGGDKIPLGDGDTYEGVTDISYYQPTDTTTTRTMNWRKFGNNWVLQSESDNTTVGGDYHPDTFDCGSGNVYVEGVVDGRVTIAAQNNIIITDDLTIGSAGAGQPPAGTDIIGLVASNSVVIYHPVSQSSNTGDWDYQYRVRSPSWSNAYCDTYAGNDLGADDEPSRGSSGHEIQCVYERRTTYNNYFTDLNFPGRTPTNGSGQRWVYASIQTLAHSFWVANYNVGNDLGDLAVRGSIAQKWRGAVGTTGGTGYLKDYSYDARLQFVSPPYFPQWVNAVWGAKTTGELEPKY